MNNFKEGKRKIKDAISKTIRKTGKNFFSSINKSLRNEENNEDYEKNSEIYDDIAEEGNEYDEDDNVLFKGSTLIGINDFGKNIELFKTIVLFQKKK